MKMPSSLDVRHEFILHYVNTDLRFNKAFIEYAYSYYSSWEVNKRSRYNVILSFFALTMTLYAFVQEFRKAGMTQHMLIYFLNSISLTILLMTLLISFNAYLFSVVIDISQAVWLVVCLRTYNECLNVLKAFQSTQWMILIVLKIISIVIVIFVIQADFLSIWDEPYGFNTTISCICSGFTYFGLFTLSLSLCLVFASTFFWNHTMHSIMAMSYRILIGICIAANIIGTVFYGFELIFVVFLSQTDALSLLQLLFQINKEIYYHIYSIFINCLLPTIQLLQNVSFSFTIYFLKKISESNDKEAEGELNQSLTDIL